MSTAPIVTVAEVSARLADPALRLADTRWYLDDPKGGRRHYLAGHLPGAVYVDLEQDLTGATGPGRHPLPSPDQFAARLGALGIGNEHFVVAYDDRGGQVAARMWWMLRDLGHDAVAVLDGGIDAWRDAALPISSEVPRPNRATFQPRPRAGTTVDRDELAESLGRVVLLDARGPERYRGDEEPIDPVAGHIPTARSAPCADNLGPDQRFLPPGVLAERYRANGVTGAAEVVAYCGSGVTACHDLLALEIAGLPGARLYPGSWSDWSSAAMPVALGDDPST